MLTSQASKMAEEKQREKRFTNAEKSDLADIVCNETIVYKRRWHARGAFIYL